MQCIIIYFYGDIVAANECEKEKEKKRPSEKGVSEEEEEGSLAVLCIICGRR